MRKKVIMMLLVAAMAGSSVPTGVMAADVTDFAGEEVGTEENEMEILENTITPIPTETPVPEKNTGSEESTADLSEKAATDSSTEFSSSEQSSVTSRKGLSQTAKILLGVMGGMVLVLIILLVALHKKENR